METYTTYIFEKSKKKTRKRFFYNATIIGAILAITILTILNFIGIGFTIIGAISLIATLIKMKHHDDKFMGITAYGDRGTKFIITETGFTLGDAELPYTELDNLMIYVDEYAGMPKGVFGMHHGGNNEISFKHKGQPYNINYVIKNKADFKKVENLVDKIEKKFPNQPTH